MQNPYYGIFRNKIKFVGIALKGYLRKYNKKIVREVKLVINA